MIQERTFADINDESRWERLGCQVMSLLLALLFAGGSMTVNRIWGMSVFVIWGTILAITFLLGRRLSMRRLLLPALPFVAWIGCYFIWGVIVSPVPALIFAIKAGVYFLIVIAAVIVCTSRPAFLTILASNIQWAILINVLILLLLTFRPHYAAFFQDPGKIGGDRFLDTERFGGLWGNANQMGFVALLLVAVSAWAKPVMAWAGRLSGAYVIYLTASRQSAWILLLMLMLHLVFVTARTPKGKWVLLFISMLVMTGATFLDPKVLTEITGNPKIARMLDYNESATKAGGGETSRVEVLKTWMPLALNGPWYGYGIAACTGESAPMIEHEPGMPIMGTHNLYLGIWIDVGILGLISFLLLVGREIVIMIKTRLSPVARWGVVSLFLAVLIDSFVKHTMLFDVGGWLAYALLFILPTSPAILACSPARSDRTLND